jgi:O-antigen ligase
LVCVALRRPHEIGVAIAAPSALLLYYWASQRLNRDDVERLFKWICIGGAVAGLIGVLQVVSGIDYKTAINGYVIPDRFQSAPQWFLHYFSVHNERAMGTRSHPLTYAECLIPPFFLFLNAGIEAWRAPSRKWGCVLPALIAALFVAGGMIASQSRGVWAGVMVGFVVYAWAQGRRFFVGAMAAGLTLGALGFALAPSTVKGRLLSVVSSSAGSAGVQGRKQTRYEMWSQAWEQVERHPLAGVGYGGVALRVKQPMDPEPRIWTETHNMYLQALLETGLVGLGLFVWVLFLGWRTIDASAWRAPLLGLFAAFLIAGLTESWTHDKEVAMLFWLLIGCAAAPRSRAEI